MRWLQAAGGIVVAALAVAGIVWAGSGQSQKLDNHVDDAAAHMTPAIHTKLGEISGKLDTLLLRTP